MKALKGNVNVPFFPVPLDMRKTFAVSEGSQFSRSCPSDTSCIKMKMSIQQWYWHRKAEVPREKPKLCPQIQLLPHIKYNVSKLQDQLVNAVCRKNCVPCASYDTNAMRELSSDNAVVQYWVYLKRLDKPQEWVPRETEQNVLLSGNEWFFQLKWKTTFYNKCLEYVIFYFILTQCIYNTRSKFNNCWVFIIPQLQYTTNAQNVLHLNQYTHGHIWSWSVAPS
jgi:hypothetical protein